MPLSLYNTLTRSKQEFKPLSSERVGMYTCGPTVYNYAHIGNLRSYIFADILRRTLEHFGYNVQQVMNVTDVGHLTSDEDAGEDKMELEARKVGKDVLDIARYYERVFFEDLEKLNIKSPAIQCRATDHINEMIALVEKLIERGHAYETSQAVYFDISTFPKYTELSRQSLEDKLVGARDEVNEDPEKRHGADFALWFKAAGRFDKHILRWESPWGVGFPGWHIECSAMSMKYLGETLDIHTGGEDHIWVHHPNEIAQSEGATGKQFVKYWMHGAFLVVGKSDNDEEENRMGKSEGNFLRLQTLIDNGYDPLAYRFLCLQAHYRAKLKFTWESLDGAVSGYSSLKNFLSRCEQKGGEEGEWVSEYRDRFNAAISDDLNIPQAMGVLGELIKVADSRKDYGVKQAIYDFDKILGLDLQKQAMSSTSADTEIEALVKERFEARKAKNWARADELRKELTDRGLILEDTADGTLWRRSS